MCKASSQEAAADFFGVLNHSGVPDPSGVSWTGHAVTGATIPVFPGETVVTNFTQMANGSWLLQFSVENELPDRGETMSSLQMSLDSNRATLPIPKSSATSHQRPRISPSSSGVE